MKIILWDIDGTVLNFKEQEKNAMYNCFKEFDLIPLTKEMLNDYIKINESYWKLLEQNKIKKADLLVQRFTDFFEKYHIDKNLAEKFNKRYQELLGTTICFNDNAYELIKELSATYYQAAATNGTYVAQKTKLTLSGLIDIFDDCFISDLIGVEKPNIGFFAHIFKTLEEKSINYTNDEIVIIGDSLTSDIKGGNTANIKTIWYNPNNLDNNSNITPTYTISNLNEIKTLL